MATAKWSCPYCRHSQTSSSHLSQCAALNYAFLHFFVNSARLLHHFKYRVDACCGAWFKTYDSGLTKSPVNRVAGGCKKPEPEVPQLYGSDWHQGSRLVGQTLPWRPWKCLVESAVAWLPEFIRVSHLVSSQQPAPFLQQVWPLASCKVELWIPEIQVPLAQARTSWDFSQLTVPFLSR